METSQTLSIESFSYSWLVNMKPSPLESSSLNNSLRASFDSSSIEEGSSFIEMDPRMPPSKRFFIRNSHDFKFDFPTSDSSNLTLLHADELFSNGYVMPVFADPVKINRETEASSSNIGSDTMLKEAPEFLGSGGKVRCSSLRRCRKLSKRILQKYLDFVKPLFQIIGRNSSSTADFGESSDKKFRATKSRIYSEETSPRVSVAFSVDDWRKSCDSDSSIYEAVLHCKRSIGK